MARLAVFIRNQANWIIAYHLCETYKSEHNGESALVQSLAPHVKTFIDVGANVGNWSDEMFAQSDARGFLYEPSAACVHRLRERFGSRNVVIREAAVADHSRTARFAEEANCGEGSSLAEVDHHPAVQYREVAVTTLDEEFVDPGVRVDFLKIDAEGYDLKVLQGAAKLLERTRFVQFEYNSQWLATGSSLLEASRFLNALGFSLYLIRASGLTPLHYDVWGDYFAYSNYFACREAERDLIGPLLRDRR